MVSGLGDLSVWTVLGLELFNYCGISKSCSEDGTNHRFVVLTFFLKDVRCHLYVLQTIICNKNIHSLDH